MKKNAVRIFLILLSVLWIAFIFSNSLENAEESGAKSSWVYELVSNIFPSITPFFIRKMGHFTEFAILGALFSATAFSFIHYMKNVNKKRYPLILCALPASFVIASFDEFLQRFSEGRHPAFTDVLIDTVGSAFGIAALSLFLLLIKAIKTRRSEKNSTNI